MTTSGFAPCAACSLCAALELFSACAAPAPRSSAPPVAVPSATPRATGSAEAPPPLAERSPPAEAGALVRVADAAPPSHVDARGDRLPLGFESETMLNALFPGQPIDGLEVSVLTWSIEVDDRPLVVDRVILWVERQNSWHVAHLYRHPLDPPPNRDEWHVAMVYDVPYVGQRSFSHAPSSSDLDLFLKETWWRFEAGGGFRYLDAGICANAWLLRMKTSPKYQFH